VEGCGSPYLTWHHFDPPWAEEQHHNPDGMIALCREHHDQADAGAFTLDQLRELKRSGRDRAEALAGRFNWMRDELLAVVGGSFYFGPLVALRVGEAPVVWFHRDARGRILVNLQMLTTSGQPRMLMLDNFWLTEGSDERTIESPPSGRLLSATYPNGDRLKVAFREVSSMAELTDRYSPDSPVTLRRLVRAADAGFPLTTVEITMNIAGTDIRLGPTQTRLPGGNVVKGIAAMNVAVGVQLDVPRGLTPPPVPNLEPSELTAVAAPAKETGDSTRVPEDQLRDETRKLVAELEAEAARRDSSRHAGDADWAEMTAKMMAAQSDDDRMKISKRYTDRLADTHQRETNELDDLFGDRVHRVAAEYHRRGLIRQSLISKLTFLATSSGWLWEAASQLRALEGQLGSGAHPDCGGV
jgi:hypothetical protein